MGNAQTKAQEKLRSALPHNLGNYESRQMLINNLILLVKTDQGLSALLGLHPEPHVQPALSWSFEYLIMPVRPGEGGPALPDSGSSRLFAPISNGDKKDYVVAIALMINNDFRWKVEAVVQSEKDRTSDSFGKKACEALNDIVSGLLADRLERVPSFASSPSSMNAPGPRSPKDGGPPRYEDIRSKH